MADRRFQSEHAIVSYNHDCSGLHTSYQTHRKPNRNQTLAVST